MSDREHHCPFLNRADHRCASFFSIERLQHAFEHCFDAYQSCEVYKELLVERLARRSEAAGDPPGGPARFLWATACKRPERPELHVQARFVQVGLPIVAARASIASIATVDAADTDAGGGAHGYTEPVA